LNGLTANCYLGVCRVKLRWLREETPGQTVGTVGRCKLPQIPLRTRCVPAAWEAPRLRGGRGRFFIDESR